MIRIGALLALSLALGACSAAPKPDLQPGAQPSKASVEGGLWMVMERAEARLRTSGKVIPDPELQAYVNDLVCRLTEAYCGQIRTYAVQRPGFNASMAPNGFMTIWSGLILRCESEAQLATVVGHEIVHYLRRHSLQRWETTRDTLGAAMVISVVSAGAGVPLGGVAFLGAVGLIQAYSRTQEQEADETGFEFMVRAGYDPKAAPKIWQNLLDEKKAADKDEPFIFFASHPPSEDRMAYLVARAEELAADAEDVLVDPSDGRFQKLHRRYLAEWLEDEVDQGRLAEMQVLLDRLKKSERSQGVVWYYQGEVLRRQPGLKNSSEAIAAYHKALEQSDAPAVTHRSLGIILNKEQDAAGALEAFRNYIAADPDAGDRGIIEFYVKELEKKS